MAEHGYAPEVIEETIVQASAAGLLDDRLFAKLWVDDRVLHRPLSRQGVIRELRDLGIAPDLIESSMRDAYPPEREAELALELGEARWPRLRGLDRDKRMQRLAGYLTRRGFSVSVARDVARRLEREER